jgi:hypothetical protein
MLGEPVVRHELKVEVYRACVIVALIVICLRAYLREKLQPCTKVPLQNTAFFMGCPKNWGW